MVSVPGLDLDPVDVHSLPMTSVEEMEAPGSPVSIDPDVVRDPVDAHTLPLVSVAEVEAPGSPVSNVPIPLAASDDVLVPVDQLGSGVLNGSREGSTVYLAPSSPLRNNLNPIADSSVAPLVPGNHEVGAHPVSVNVFTQVGVSVQCNVWTEESLSRLSSVLFNQLERAWKDNPPCLKVYTRRKKISLKPVQDDAGELSSPLQEFKSVVTKPINGLLPPLGSPVGGRGPCQVTSYPGTAGEWLSFLQSWVLVLLPRSADIWVSVMKMRISLKDASGYAKLFENGLSSNHIVVVATLFGWEVPLVGQC